MEMSETIRRWGRSKEKRPRAWRGESDNDADFVDFKVMAFLWCTLILAKSYSGSE